MVKPENMMEETPSAEVRAVAIGPVVLMALAVAAFAAGLCVNPVSVNDLFWQLRTGDGILATHTLPHRDTYSYISGRPWVLHEWMAFVLFSLAHKAGGFGGVWVLMCGLVVVTFVVLFLATVRESRSPLTALIATVVAAMTATKFFSPRPQLFTYLALAILIWIVLEARRGRPKLVYGALVLFPIWINFHAGAIVGVGLLAAFAVCDGVEGRVRAGLDDEERARLTGGALHLGIAAVLAALLTLVSPYSWHIYQNMAATVGNGVAMNLVAEWLSPDFHQEFGQLLECYLFFVVLSVGFSRERRSFADAAIVVLLIHEALNANRNVPLLAIVSTPLIVRHTQSAIGRLASSGEGLALFGPRPPAAVAGVTLLVLGMLSAMQAVSIVRVVDPGAGVSLASVAETSFQLKAFPYGACAFLEREGFPTTMRLYNKYDDGGFLIWRVPQYKVMTDGRADVYFGKELDDVRRLNALEYDWGRVVDGYGCDVVLIGTLQKQARVFLGSPDWAAVYVDRASLTDPNFHINNSVILVRRDAAHAALIQKCRRDCPELVKLQASALAFDFPSLK